MSENEKKAYIDQAFEHFLVDGTRSATPEEEGEEKENEIEEKELTFSSVDNAIQFLADHTNSKVIISD